jgi:RNA-binding protein
MAPPTGPELTGKQRQHLRGLAHSKKPVVLAGKHGLTETLVAEVDGALTAHELIKVKVSADAPLEVDALATSLAQTLGATVVQTIGHVAALYRRHPTSPRIALPSAAAKKASGSPT